MKNILYLKVLVILSGISLLFSTPSFIVPDREFYGLNASQGVELTIIVPDYQLPGVENVTDDFLASPLGRGVASVNVQSSGVVIDEQLTYLQTLMQSGTATNHVISLDVIWTAYFAANGWIVNLDPYLDSNEMDDYSPGIVTACKYQGNQYAYPYFMNLGALYYRKDLLDLHLPGWTEADFDTWEELNVTANYILNNETGLLDNPELVGYIGQFDAYEGGVVNFFEWAGSNGALDLITSIGGVNINTPDVKKAMEFIKALVAPRYTGVQGNDYIIPRQGLVDDEASSVAKWVANESLFMRQWTFAYGLSEGANIKFGIAPLPHFAGAIGFKTSCVGGSIMAIPTATIGNARDAALNLTKFLGDVLAQEAELTSDIDPGPEYHPLLNFPALKSVYNNPPIGFEWIKNWTDQVDLTLTRPVHLKYPQISFVIAEYFSDLLSCQKTVDDALSKMERNVLEIIYPQSPQPGSFVLSSDAGTPDDDGIFNLMWTLSDGALNYSVYEYSSYISVINENLTLLVKETTNLSLHLSEYSDGIYYFIVFAFNDYGDINSNSIKVIVQILLPSEIPGYTILFLIMLIGIGLIIVVKKWRKDIIKS
ncbi:MAG: extracellular solute-binding protein [Candidatus Thorarchaeota archaeon]